VRRLALVLRQAYGVVRPGITRKLRNPGYSDADPRLPAGIGTSWSAGGSVPLGPNAEEALLARLAEALEPLAVAPSEDRLSALRAAVRAEWEPTGPPARWGHPGRRSLRRYGSLRRHGSMRRPRWTPRAVVSGIAATLVLGSGAAVAAGVPIPRSIRTVVSEMGLPVASPAVATAQQATATLQADLAQSAPLPMTADAARDLADQLRQLDPQQRAQVSGHPDHLIQQACQSLRSDDRWATVQFCAQPAGSAASGSSATPVPATHDPTSTGVGDDGDSDHGGAAGHGDPSHGHPSHGDISGQSGPINDDQQGQDGSPAATGHVGPGLSGTTAGRSGASGSPTPPGTGRPNAPVTGPPATVPTTGGGSSGSTATAPPGGNNPQDPTWSSSPPDDTDHNSTDPVSGNREPGNREPGSTAPEGSGTAPQGQAIGEPSTAPRTTSTPSGSGAPGSSTTPSTSGVPSSSGTSGSSAGTGFPGTDLRW